MHSWPIARYGLLFGVLWTAVAGAAVPQLEDSDRFEWDYDEEPSQAQPPTAVPPEHFCLYVRPAPQDPPARMPVGTLQAVCQAKTYGVAVAIAPGLPQLVTQIQREEVFLVAPGLYYAVVTAVAREHGLESEPSNSVLFRFGRKPGEEDPPFEAPPPMRPLPPPVVARPPTPGLPLPDLPPPSIASVWVTSTQMWRGVRETPYTLPRRRPRAQTQAVTETLMWHGDADTSGELE